MALFGKNNVDGSKSGTSNGEGSKPKHRTYNYNICVNPKARHAPGKCLEDPKNKDLRKQWELKNNKKWKKFSDYKKNHIHNNKKVSLKEDDD